ncbi:hypothetical protein [Paenirhodobacter populi]|uniref:hypothetical protein n=1 Tax=Paenirhodobacter populi TaxID=2306993 RepID=UPI0019D4D3E3|nr:hypothetical protein [Sinirhodobacter populi]
MGNVLRPAVFGQDRPVIFPRQLEADGSKPPTVHLADFGLGAEGAPSMSALQVQKTCVVLEYQRSEFAMLGLNGIGGRGAGRYVSMVSSD